MSSDSMAVIYACKLHKVYSPSFYKQSKNIDHFKAVVMHPAVNISHAKMYNRRERVQCFEYCTWVHNSVFVLLQEHALQEDDWTSSHFTNVLKQLETSKLDQQQFTVWKKLNKTT